MKTSIMASTLAVTALFSSQAAMAQQSCVEPADAADAVVYIMPTAYDAALSTCDAQFDATSFLPSEDGVAFIERFRGEQDARWPGTFRFFKVFIQRETADNDGMAEMIAAMPEDAMRPFIDAILGQIITKEIKPDTCGKVDRVVELLSPLPAENLGGLVEFILPEVNLKDPPICAIDEAVAVIPEGSESE